MIDLSILSVVAIVACGAAAIDFVNKQLARRAIQTHIEENHIKAVLISVATFPPRKYWPKYRSDWRKTDNWCVLQLTDRTQRWARFRKVHRGPFALELLTCDEESTTENGKPDGLEMTGLQSHRDSRFE